MHYRYLFAGTITPNKVCFNGETGPPIVNRVIAIDNPVLLQRFKVAMDKMEAKGEGVGTWSDDDDLRVLRMSVPDIAQYATRQNQALTF